MVVVFNVDAVVAVVVVVVVVMVVVFNVVFVMVVVFNVDAVVAVVVVVVVVIIIVAVVVWKIDSGVEANHRLAAEKNLNLFESMGVMSNEECLARDTVLQDHYSGTVEVETGTFIDMINQQ